MSNVQFSKDLSIPPGRSAYLKTILMQTCKQSSMTSATSKNVYVNDAGEASVVIPKDYFTQGCTFKATMAGTKSGTNAAFTILVALNGTTLMTCTADDTSAVDWLCEMTVACKTNKIQNCFGKLMLDTADPDIQYDAGAVDTTQGGTLVFTLGGNSSDTVNCEYFQLEYWKVPTP